jgi:hypothetical protein
MSEELQYTTNPLNFPNLLVPKKTMSYQRWWDSSVKSDNPDFWHSGNETNPVTHGEYVVDFYYKLKELINKSGYVIDNEKQFKDEISTLIYHLSNEE